MIQILLPIVFPLSFSILTKVADSRSFRYLYFLSILSSTLVCSGLPHLSNSVGIIMSRSLEAPPLWRLRQQAVLVNISWWWCTSQLILIHAILERVIDRDNTRTSLQSLLDKWVTSKPVLQGLQHLSPCACWGVTVLSLSMRGSLTDWRS